MMVKKHDEKEWKVNSMKLSRDEGNGRSKTLP
jgi:hypothetical protein